MIITKDLKDELNAVVKVVISKDDYEVNVEKKLTDYRKKAKIDGFRPGKVPAGLIRKMYGKSVMADEINHLLSENLQKYLQEEHIHILGDPLPSETDQKPIDWENSTEFEFAFDLGLTPQFEVTFSKKDRYVIYSIIPDPKLIQAYSDNYARRYGAYKPSEIIEDGKEMVKGTLVELSSAGTVQDGGLHVSDSTIYLEFMKDEEIKKEFMGLHAGDVVTFNLRKAFPNNVELGSILHLKKEEVAHIDSDFQFTLEEISKFENAEINQELFDKIFGKDIVSSMDEFNARLVAEIQVNLSRETDNKFRIDTKSLLLDKSNFKLPEAFLKRWIISTNEGKSTMEQIEQDFVKFERDLKWHLIQNKIISEHELKLTDEEIIEFARKQTRIQFEQYGLYNTTEEQINNYTQESLKQDDYRRHILEHMYEDKVFEFIRESVTLVTKEVTAEEFDKILEEESIT